MKMSERMDIASKEVTNDAKREFQHSRALDRPLDKALRRLQGSAKPRKQGVVWCAGDYDVSYYFDHSTPQYRKMQRLMRLRDRTRKGRGVI